MKIRTPKYDCYHFSIAGCSHKYLRTRSLRHCNYHSSMHRSRWKIIHTPCGRTSASQCNIRSSNGERRSSRSDHGQTYWHNGSSRQCSSRAVRSQLRSTDQLGSRCIGPMPAAAAQSAATLCMWRTIVRTRSCSLLWFVKIAHTDQKLCCRRLHTSRHSCPEFLRGSCRCSHRSTLRQLQRPLLRMPRGCTG